MKHKLIVLIGPTGVGKTELSLSLAEFLHTSIINADSRQIFKDIPIGTAAPTPEEQLRIQHYFVGTLNLTDYYSAAQFETDVIALLKNLFKTQNYALMSGGSMMYIDAVCKGIDDMPTIDNEIRVHILERYKQDGLEVMCQELKLLDPDYYKIVDTKNPKRVIHALEVCYMTGKPYSSFRTRQNKKRPFDIIKIGLQREREELYDRINQRVEAMIENGLIDEVKRVAAFRNCNALNTVGYKEIFQYLDGNWPYETAIEKIKQNTRIYSRKQMTWYRKDPEIRWFHPNDKESIKNFIENELTK